MIEDIAKEMIEAVNTEAIKEIVRMIAENTVSLVNTIKIEMIITDLHLINSNTKIMKSIVTQKKKVIKKRSRKVSEGRRQVPKGLRSLQKRRYNRDNRQEPTDRKGSKEYQPTYQSRPSESSFDKPRPEGYSRPDEILL